MAFDERHMTTEQLLEAAREMDRQQRESPRLPPQPVMPLSEMRRRRKTCGFRGTVAVVMWLVCPMVLMFAIESLSSQPGGHGCLAAGTVMAWWAFGWLRMMFWIARIQGLVCPYCDATVNWIELPDEAGKLERPDDSAARCHRCGRVIIDLDS